MSFEDNFAKRSQLIVGVLSDTHLPYRATELPNQLVDVFAEVDLILHAGDVDHIHCLQPLQALAPLYAVRGNVHLLDFSTGGIELPSVVQKNLAGRQVVVTHGHQHGIMGWLYKGSEVFCWDRSIEGARKRNLDIAKRLHKQFPKADCIIFGHTHTVFSERLGDTLLFNPGSTLPVEDKIRAASVGILRIKPTKIEPEIIRLNKVAK